MGIGAILNQTFRLLSHDRLHRAVEIWEERYPGVDIILIEPELDDETMFGTSILDYRARLRSPSTASSRSRSSSPATTTATRRSPAPRARSRAPRAPRPRPGRARARENVGLAPRPRAHQHGAAAQHAAPVQARTTSRRGRRLAAPSRQMRTRCWRLYSRPSTSSTTARISAARARATGAADAASQRPARVPPGELGADAERDSRRPRRRRRRGCGRGSPWAGGTSGPLSADRAGELQRERGWLRQVWPVQARSAASREASAAWAPVVGVAVEVV